MATVKIKLRTNRLNKEQEAPLVLRVIQDRKYAETSLRKFVRPSEWNHNKDELRRAYPHFSTLSVYLDREKYKVQQIVNELRMTGEKFTAKDVIDIYRGKGKLGSKTIVELIHDYIRRNPHGLDIATIKCYEIAVSRWEECHPRLLVCDLEESHLDQFNKYLRESCNNNPNTVYNRMKVIKKIARLAHRKGWLEKDPFNGYKLQRGNSKREYLERSELRIFESFEPTTELQKEVKDVFMFSCYSGIRFGDCCTLTSKNFREGFDENGKFLIIELNMSKTDKLLSFRMPRKCVEILENYRESDWPWSLPVLKKREYRSEAHLKRAISSRNALYNKELKTIASTLELKKHLTFHCSRHSFATLALSLAVPMEVVSKLLGHRDLQTTQVYAKILDKSKDEAISKLNKL